MGCRLKSTTVYPRTSATTVRQSTDESLYPHTQTHSHFTLAPTHFYSDVSVDAAVLRAASPDAWTLPRTPAYRHLLNLPRPDPWGNTTTQGLSGECSVNTVESTEFMNQSVFAHFLKESAPLLIRGVGVGNPKWDLMRRRFTPEWLKENLGMAMVSNGVGWGKERGGLG